MKKIFCECGSRTAHLGNIATKFIIIVCIAYTIYSFVL